MFIIIVILQGTLLASLMSLAASSYIIASNRRVPANTSLCALLYTFMLCALTNVKYKI